MFRIGILTLLCSMAICSFGFTMNRSELIESTWDTAPSLDTYQRTHIDPATKDRMQMTNTHEISQVPNTKVSEKLTEESAPGNQTRERRSEIITNSKIGLNPFVKSINNIESAIKNDSSKSSGESRKTRNVILLLIDEKDQKAENLWQNYVRLLPLAIEGSFQSCRDMVKINATSLGNVSIAKESAEEDCNCEHLLYANIEELLSWVRNILGMTTGSVSNSNFLVLDPLTHKDLNNLSTDFHGLRKRKVRDATLEVHKSDDESSNVWEMSDLNEHAQTVPDPDPSFYKTETVTDYGGMRNVFDVLSKIGMTFIRSLFESLRRSNDTPVDETLEGYPWLRSTFVGLLETVLNNIKSMRNSEGYMVVAVAPRDETADAIDHLQRQISANDTLLIVTYPCFGDKKSIPFIAQGPNSEILREIKIIWELPIAIRKAITSNCYDLGCIDRQGVNVTNRTRTPIEIFLHELLPKHHFNTNKIAVE